MLTVRPMTFEDFGGIINYFCGNPPDYYDRLGIDPEKVPSADDYRKTLEAFIDLPANGASAFYSIWVLNGEAVGHSSLKDILYGKSGSQHLHLWKPLERGKGYGGIFFCLSTIDFYERFQLKQIICEPKSSNPLPNRMLQKIGFPLIRTHVAASSEISQVCELNTYRIEKQIAEDYLRRVGMLAT
jgi:hypothetical protein